MQVHDFEIALHRPIVRVSVAGAARVDELSLTRGGQDMAIVEREAQEQAEQRRMQHESGFRALGEAVDEFRSVMTEMSREFEQHVVGLALRAARKVLSQEVEGREHRVVKLVEAAVGFIGDLAGAELAIKLHPSDVEAVQREITDGSGLSLPSGLRLVPSVEIDPGTCEVTTNETTVISDWRTQLQIVEEALLGTSNE